MARLSVDRLPVACSPDARWPDTRALAARRTVKVLALLTVLASLLLGACQPASTPTPTAAPKTEAKPAAVSPAAASPAAVSPAGASPAALPASASPAAKTAASPASGSPAAKASPSPAAGQGASGESEGFLAWVQTTNGILSVIGIILTIVVVVAWIMSNRAEATPNVDQLQEMRHFVREHFAPYVAHGLIAEGADPPSIARDPAWRKIYLQHLRLHNELYAFRGDVALQVFEQEIDAAVRHQRDALRAAGERANPAVQEEP